MKAIRDLRLRFQVWLSNTLPHDPHIHAVVGRLTFIPPPKWPYDAEKGWEYAQHLIADDMARAYDTLAANEKDSLRASMLRLVADETRRRGKP